MNTVVRYFDGKSAFEADISITPNGLVIQKKDFPSEPFLWKFNSIRSIEPFNKKYLLKYGQEFPFQTLEIDSEIFISELKKHYKIPELSKSTSSSSPAIKGLLIVFALIVGLGAFFYFAAIPIVIEGVAEVFPREAEVAMGKQLRDTYVQQETIDSGKTSSINKFYSVLKVNTEYKINITVVKSQVKNAFALPGGEIIVYSAILDSMKQYSELAALLGHENGHIEKRHTLKLILKNLSNYILIAAFFDDFSGLMTTVLQNAAAIEQLSYNRAVETESDEFGFEVMVKNKINPEGMVMLFEQLKADTTSGGEVPEFLLTHPKLEDRIEAVQQRINAFHYSSVPNDSLEYYFKKLKIN